MRRSRLSFKYALRQCKQNEDSIRADEYAKSLMDKDMASFWKSIRKSNNVRVPLPSMIDGCTGDKNIADMWQDHYKSTVLRTQHIKSSCTTNLTLFITNPCLFLLQIFNAR